MKESRSRNKNKVKFNTVSRVLIILLTAVFMFSAYKLVTVFRSYKADSSSYDAVRELATDDIDWAELREINPDVVGWIRLSGSNIDYPVVQGDDNDRYLTTLFDGSPGNAGGLSQRSEKGVGVCGGAHLSGEMQLLLLRIHCRG